MRRAGGASLISLAGMVAGRKTAVAIKEWAAGNILRRVCGFPQSRLQQ